MDIRGEDCFCLDCCKLKCGGFGAGWERIGVSFRESARIGAVLRFAGVRFLVDPALGEADLGEFACELPVLALLFLTAGVVAEALGTVP